MEKMDTDDMKNSEVKLIMNFLDDAAPQAIPSIEEFHVGHYEQILNNKFSSSYLKKFVNDDNLVKCLLNAVDDDPNCTFQLLSTGIASLLFFVQTNFTGPENTPDVDWLLGKREEALEFLHLEDECNENVKKPELLYLSKILFSNEKLQNHHKTAAWWLFRANLLHQIVLEEASATLFKETDDLIERISADDILGDEYLRTLFHVETVQFYLYHRRIQNMEKHVEIAQHSAKLNMQLVGMLGKRTKYQQDEKAQLMLKVSMDKDNFPHRKCQDLPTALELNDDLRLERVEYSEAAEIIELGALEEAVVLAKYFQIQKSQPKDKLADEEVVPYLNNVIENSSNWPLRMSSLCQRCVLESNHKRTVERSMSQTEYLIEQLNSSKPLVSHRMDIFFASGMKPVWEVRQTLADLMLNLGMVKSALDLYLQLRLWESVIVCYTILELRHKAAEIIQQEIDKKPTVKLWCLLGDATQDTKCYETAWKLSGEKSSRAQRHWGLHYYSKQNYTEAVPHLKLSVELNNIQENIWIRLGFAALQIEDWKLAANAYRHYCALEQMNFEAWNNLAKAYIKLGDKPRAWRSLQDAVKCNFDRWEVWDNLMVVSIDLGHFSEVIRCYHRILELKAHHTDVQILKILTKAIITDIKDADGNPASKLLQKALELFGHLTSAVPNNASIWQMYAELTATKNTEMDYQKAAQYLQRAHRTAVANPKWFKEVEATIDVLHLCADLAESYLKCAESGSPLQRRAMLGSAKLSLQGVVRKVKDQDWIGQTVIDESLANIEAYLTKIMDELKKINIDSNYVSQNITL
ncbi:tetratricopeptide repeat protein 27 isoform X1 [Diprion similis]|uniref:tetratricopeptide repeat protein 27 isoform X1 n=1 Tax=Diprion similis TaxID=362088 RepID=UPI001EF7DF5E|nr:tetratricopeptide repeat protein 27 isoform X1 [Diprion similis]